MGLKAFAKLAGAFFAAAFFVATALSAPQAHADEMQDYYFFQYLDQKLVPYGGKQDAVRQAKDACLKISRPGNPASIGYGVAYNLQKEMSLTSAQAQEFIVASIYSFCPRVYGIK